MDRYSFKLINPRPALSTSAEPRTTLQDWRVVEFDGGRLLVGFLQNNITCRLTTEIAAVNVHAREIRTRSGRVYELVGPPATAPERLILITVRVALSIRPPFLDVTEEVWGAMCRATN